MKSDQNNKISKNYPIVLKLLFHKFARYPFSAKRCEEKLKSDVLDSFIKTCLNDWRKYKKEFKYYHHITDVIRFEITLKMDLLRA